MAEPEQLPPGQVAREDFPRFGWGKFAFRFPTNAKSISVEFWRDGREYRFVGPRFMDHPRARVALEERGRGVPAWLLRRTYPALVPLIGWLFRVGLERHLSRSSGAPGTKGEA